MPFNISNVIQTENNPNLIQPLLISYSKYYYICIYYVKNNVISVLTCLVVNIKTLLYDKREILIKKYSLPGPRLFSPVVTECASFTAEGLYLVDHSDTRLSSCSMVATYYYSPKPIHEVQNKYIEYEIIRFC